MAWRRTDPVQEIGALILVAEDAARRLAETLRQKPALLAGLKAEHGLGWAALFAAPVGTEGEVVLPRIAGAIPLHERADGWWFPVGTRLDVPAHVEQPMIAAMAAAHGVRTPAVAIPRFEGGNRASAADIYPIVDPRPIDPQELDGDVA
jgi:hypothetical protein